MLRLHLRVWWTSPAAAAVRREGALVVTAVVITVALALIHSMPAMNVALLLLIPMGMSGFVATPRPRPARRRPAVTVPVDAYVAAPGTRVPALLPGCGAGTHYSQPGGSRLGLRPAAARLPDIPVAAAGPYAVGRAAVPGGAR